jgi:hypothetical protein
VRLLYLVLMFWQAVPALAAEVRIAFPAVQKMMADQEFTQEGRKYVRGDKSHKCDFAYLENPRIGEWNGQLVIKARFSGRRGLDVLGRCVGLGDAFDVTVVATPLVKRGVLALADVKVDTGAKDSFYIRKVRTALQESLGKQFVLDVKTKASELLEQRDPAAGFRRELSSFEFRQVKMSRDAVILDIDFVLTVK